MVKQVVDSSLYQRVHQYQIVGRAAPTNRNPIPKIYRMRLFGKNLVLAKSKFWYFMKKLTKAKRSGGEILGVTEIFDKGPTKVKNYAIWLRYESRTNTHNMYKEYRDTTINGAVGQMYAEMAGRHRAQAGAIQIINTAVIPSRDARRDHIKQVTKSGLKFPQIRVVPLVKKSLRTTFKAKRAQTFLQ